MESVSTPSRRRWISINLGASISAVDKRNACMGNSNMRKNNDENNYTEVDSDGFILDSDLETEDDNEFDTEIDDEEHQNEDNDEDERVDDIGNGAHA